MEREKGREERIMSNVPWDNSGLGMRGYLDITSALQLWAWRNDFEITSATPIFQNKAQESWRIWLYTDTGISIDDVNELEEMLSDIVKQINKKSEVNAYLKEASPTDQKGKILALIVIEIYNR